MATTPHYTHWHFDHDDGGIVWLSIDKADSAVNVLSAAVFAEFDTILTALETAPPRGLVIQSAKRSGFIAGADVGEFTGFADEPAALAAIHHHLPDPGLLPRRGTRIGVGLRCTGRRR